MSYSIGEVANMCGINISTLRYYDREGMFPQIQRSEGGIRVFSELEINTLRVIECLKSSGMSIKEIKEFLIWCQDGDDSLQNRCNLFHHRYEEVQKQIAALQDTLHTLEYKCWYYDTALADGSEEVVKDIAFEDIPEAIRDFKI